MKALIISEDSKFIDCFDDFFSQKGFDTIIYKWLLKALDNIEEIRPNCVILSSSEYPRHWKTLVQFIKSGIGGDEIAVYLYEPNPLSQKEEIKAKTLGITGFVKSLETSELELFEKNINTFFDLDSIPLKKLEAPGENIISVESLMSDKKPSQELNGSGQFIYTDPVTSKFIDGIFFDKNNNKITAKVSKNNLQNLQNNQHIEYFSYEIKNDCYSTSAKIQEILDINEEKFIIFELDE